MLKLSTLSEVHPLYAENRESTFSFILTKKDINDLNVGSQVTVVLKKVDETIHHQILGFKR